MADQDVSVEDIEKRHKALSARRESFYKDVTNLKAESDSRKRALREALDEAKAAGFNPENMQEEVRKAKEVVVLKLDNLEADLAAGEELVRPMLREIG